MIWSAGLLNTFFLFLSKTNEKNDKNSKITFQIKMKL